jgi:hypothetical protein
VRGGETRRTWVAIGYLLSLDRKESYGGAVANLMAESQRLTKDGVLRKVPWLPTRESNPANSLW